MFPVIMSLCQVKAIVMFWFHPIANMTLEAGLLGLGLLLWGEIDTQCQRLGLCPESIKPDTNFSSTSCINVIGAPFVNCQGHFFKRFSDC